MKIQRHLSHKRGDKVYHKYVIVLPDNLIQDSGFQEGDELEAEAKKGEIRLRRK
jgi:bifunctional DNA-binding transcriptional regulator/antitoxin component of YhaV-PrlF toxin-antitoxin module